MSPSTPSLDLSSKGWLAAFAVALLVSVTVIVHMLAKALAPAPEQPTPVLHATQPKPMTVSAPVSWPEPAVPSTDGLSEAQRKTNLQKEVHEQANYLRQLSKQYPKTASLPKPEEIDQMEKEGRLVQ